MSTIGYAIFKKNKTFAIDANGMFEQLKLSDTVFIHDTPQLNAGETRICFQRLASNRLKSSLKDAILVSINVQIVKNNTVGILGSAIVFKEYQVNEKKIIDGVNYLLSQLRRNFESEYNLNDTELGVILPSVNGNFNIFKEESLSSTVLKQTTKYVDTTSLSQGKTIEALHHFCTHAAFLKITHLVLLSDQTSVTGFLQNGFEKVAIAQLVAPPKVEQPKIPLQNSDRSQNKALQTEIHNLKNERDKAVNTKKKYGLFAILSAVGMLVFGILYFTTETENGITEISSHRSSLYEMNENMYISFHKYNVNIRSSPIYYKDNRNVKATLSDGDEIKVLGFDKQTMWAKISYNEGSEVGYVSNKLISKKIDIDRVKKIKRNARIQSSYSNVPIYNAPEEIGEYDPYKDKFKYLNQDDKIFVKSEDLRRNSFSIMYKKNNKIYHGYIEGKHFEYQ